MGASKSHTHIPRTHQTVLGYKSYSLLSSRSTTSHLPEIPLLPKLGSISFSCLKPRSLTQNTLILAEPSTQV